MGAHLCPHLCRSTPGSRGDETDLASDVAAIVNATRFTMAFVACGRPSSGGWFRFSTTNQIYFFSGIVRRYAGVWICNRETSVTDNAISNSEIWKLRTRNGLERACVTCLHLFFLVRYKARFPYTCFRVTTPPPPRLSSSSIASQVIDLLCSCFPFATRTCGPSSSIPTSPIFIINNVQNRFPLQPLQPLKSLLTSTSPPPRPSHRPSSPTLLRCTTAARQRCFQTSVPCPVVMREKSLIHPILVVRAVSGSVTWKILKRATSILACSRHTRSSHQVYPPYFSVSRAMPNDLPFPSMYALCCSESDDSDVVRTPPEPMLSGPPIAIRFGSRNMSDAMLPYSPTQEEIESALLFLPHAPSTPLKTNGKCRSHSVGRMRSKEPRQESADGRIQRHSDFAVPTLDFEGCLGGF